MAERHISESLLSRAMQNPDKYVIEMEYTDSEGVTTQRVVSPIAFKGQTHLQAMCLCREAVRTFKLESCKNVRLVESHDVLMPEQIKILSVGK